MGFIGIVSGLAGAVATAISGFASSIGPALVNVGRVLVANLPKIETGLKIVSAVVQTISVVLGLINKNDTAEELGAKAVESDKKPEDFRSTEEYIHYLRNEVKLDSQKMDTLKTEDRMAYTTIGSVILAKGIEEKFRVNIPVDFWVEVGKQKMNADEAKAYIENFKANGFDEVKLSDYLKGKLPIAELKQVAPIIENTLKQLQSELTPEQVQSKIMEMKQVSSGIESR
ncbi:hypothetical protein [Neobacillus dielmonensis]|uniref:hypothetical protein n=1 Tax=Neobacillus dielmonensis TaxID=1347369 RepID=UPI0005A7717E|nr:hypothetical protein [Neobacillus dielmonensis]